MIEEYKMPLLVASTALLVLSVGCAPDVRSQPRDKTDAAIGAVDGGSAGAGGTGGGGNTRDAGGAGEASSGGGAAGGSGPDSGSDRGVTGIEDGGRTCGVATVEIPYSPSVPDVIIAFDDSSSMEESFGSGTRYTTVRDVLKPLVTMYEGRVRWGFERFPARGMKCRGGTSGCCGEAVCVGPALGNAVAVNAAIDRTGPSCAPPVEPPPPPPSGCGGPGQSGCPGMVMITGGTPTPVALANVKKFYDGFVDGIKERYILLSTDGEPNCSHEVAGEGQACTAAVGEIAALLGSGVKTVVLGVSEEVSASGCLDRMGQAGGAPRPGGPQAFYPAADPAALEKFLAEIISGIAKPSCTIDLASPPPDPTKLAVFFDGKQVPHDPTHKDGWDFETGSTTRIIVHGSYCSRVQAFEVRKVEVLFGCPPCGGTVGC